MRCVTMVQDDTQEVNTTRRRVLLGTSAGIVTSFAGCSSGSGSGSDNGTKQNKNSSGSSTNSSEQNTENTSKKETEKEIKSGGKFRFGATTGPDTLNILTGISTNMWLLNLAIYDRGVVYHPKTGEVVPWVIKDWSVSDVSTGKPVITATVREDMSWHDGEKLTAEDVAFTIKYANEKKPSGIGAFDTVESVSTSGKYELEYHLKEKTASWRQEILRAPVIPKHIWSDVDDPNNFSPRKEEALIGSGPFVLDDYSWDNWFRLKPREDVEKSYNIPEDVDFINNDAPFVDQFRYEIYGSSTSLTKALFNGNVDMADGSVSPGKAVDAKKKKDLNVLQGGASSFSYIAYNLRRTPFDDKAFRQLLTLAWPGTYYSQNLERGIGVVNGDLGAPAAFKKYRPYPPDNSEVERFRFEKVAKDNKKGTIDINKAREFILNYENSKHDYSLDDSTTDITKSGDGKALYIDGEPIPKAHSNNDGENGQGPLEFSMTPPKKSPKVSQAFFQWLKNLQKIGIPVQQKVQSSDSALNVFNDEQFDMYEGSWSLLNPSLHYLCDVFGPCARDTDNTSDAFKQNIMAYAGADKILKKQSQTMDEKKRKDLVHDSLMKIYNDQPMNVYAYGQTLQPVNSNWTGFVNQPGGAAGRFSWMNIRQS